MLVAVRAWVDKYEILFMGIICVIMAYGGWYFHGVFDRAAETNQAISTLKAQQTQDAANFKENVAQDEKSVANDAKNKAFNKIVEANAIKTPIPNCNIPADRIMYINTAAHRK